MMNFKKGFTLIELLIVIAIIGILAGAVIVSLADSSDEADNKVAKANVAQAGRFVTISKHITANSGNFKCPTGVTNTGGGTPKKLYCAVSGSTAWVVYQHYKTETSGAGLDAWCMDQGSTAPEEVSFNNNQTTAGTANTSGCKST